MPAPSARVTAALAVGVVIWVVLVGGTSWGELHLLPRVINAAIAGGLLILYVLTIRDADRLDGLVLLAAIAFVVAALLSDYQRQSLDAAVVALTYAAGLFVARRVVAGESVRSAVLNAMAGLSLLLAILTASRWSVVVEWWSLTGWGAVPPLNMELDATPWGHRHDMSLLLVLLYPAWWTGRRTPMRTSLAIVTGILTAYAVIVDGSRSLWLAVGLATLLTLAPFVLRALRGHPRVAAGLAAGAALLLLLAAVGGPVRNLVERLFTTDTLAARTEMWGALTGLWSEQPLTGLGPGTFPFALQHTDYFDTNAWAPRHPDNLLVQVVTEAGMLGILAVALVLVAVLPAIVRSRFIAARWALIALAVASLGSNPSEFAFLLAPSIVWTSIATAKPAGSRDATMPAATWMRVGTLAALGVVGLAILASAVGAIFYDAARTSVARGDLSSAANNLELARTVDPSLALYARAHGFVQLADGDASAAIGSLERATALAPADDQAWRGLALARAEDGDHDGARDALAEAIDRQRSDPVNLMLALDVGESDRELIGEIVQAWPQVLAAPGWDELAGVSPDDAVAAALERWQRLPDSPEREVDQAILLAAWGNRPDLLEAAIEESPLTEDLARAMAASASCDPGAARLLDDAASATRRTAPFWALRIREADEPTERARNERIYEIMTGRSLAHRMASGSLNPLGGADLAAFNLDEWGYRRPSFPDVPWPMSLPSPNAGRVLWIEGAPIGAGCQG